MQNNDLHNESEAKLLPAESPSEKSEKFELTSDSVLNSYGNRNAYQLFVFISMALCWCWTAFPAMVITFAVGDICMNKTGCKLTPGSIIEDFHLIGADSYKAEIAITISTIGNLFGSTVLSRLSDMKGRRPVLISSLFLLGLLGVLSSFSPNIYVFAFLRLSQGVFSSGIASSNWVLAYESTSMGLRSYSSLVFGLVWVVGYVLVAPLCYYVTYWRHQILVASLPCVISAIVYYFTIPESFHFAVSNNQKETVKRWYSKMNGGRENGRKMEEVDFLIEEHLNDKNANEKDGENSGLFSALWRKKSFLVYLLVISYVWSSDSFVYSGLYLISTTLAGNKFWNFALTGFAEIPSYIVSPYLLEKMGRRAFVSVMHLLTSLAFIGTIFIDHENASFGCWLIGKFAISCAYTAIFVYSSEVFPTVYRSGCIGICMFISCFGGAASGSVRSMNVVSPNLPNIFFAGAALLAALLTLLLPETRGKQLPDSTAEVEVEKRESAGLSKRFLGNWTVAYDENFDEYLYAQEYGYFLRRLFRMVTISKSFQAVKGTNERDPPKYKYKLRVGSHTINWEFELDKEFIGEYLDGNNHNVTFSYDNSTKILRETQIASDNQYNLKPTVFEYRIVKKMMRMKFPHDQFKVYKYFKKDE
ncbi:unnamed protein product [Bursaphelenchus xylophilus]|uniref:(pine wood nematode) hypothetical protein n=1 Tax=Bursaphelenchus xylophilus TaxID=6326 RepID=A0A1I7RXW9_BURXY|nr:unnamed protein product [Bursaphelenchus xylophilus]CAG9125219.1 unnamed protein product [Bursaphelenchus xylophilus]